MSFTVDPIIFAVVQDVWESTQREMTPTIEKTSRSSIVIFPGWRMCLTDPGTAMLTPSGGN